MNEIFDWTRPENVLLLFVVSGLMLLSTVSLIVWQLAVRPRPPVAAPPPAPATTPEDDVSAELLYMIVDRLCTALENSLTVMAACGERCRTRCCDDDADDDDGVFAPAPPAEKTE